MRMMLVAATMRRLRMRHRMPYRARSLRMPYRMSYRPRRRLMHRLRTRLRLCPPYRLRISMHRLRMCHRP
jgi:hypothetical protein